jgi:alkaline phosphatase D
MSRRPFLPAALVCASCVVSCVVSCGGAPARAPASSIPFAAPPAIGEIGAHGAIVWARATEEAFLHVALEGPHDAREVIARASAEHDLTARVELEDLVDRDQPLRVWLSASAEHEAAPAEAFTSTLALAPPPSEPAAVTFGFGGDIGGQNVCRDTTRGWPIVSDAADDAQDFFIVLGDAVYADATCEATGRYGNAQIPGDFPESVALEDFRAHYRYAEADPAFDALRARSYAVWDDHETTNDVGPTRDTRGGTTEHLLPVGRRAFVEHAPLPSRWMEDPLPSLHRRVRWGRHLELFFLDTRSFRDANEARDDGPVPKTMLGAAQRDWLIEGLTTSDATWRVVVSSVPIAIPTGWPRDEENDSWADGGSGRGFERELAAIFEAVHAAHVPRLVFVTTDVHFSETIRYRPIESDPSFEVWELVTGPMGAGIFPNRELDETFRPERLFFHGPEVADTTLTFDEALTWMSWGRVAIVETGALHYEVRGLHDQVLSAMDLSP